jgi:hypothetical protein
MLVVLYGSSLALSSIGAALAAQPGTRVLAVDPRYPCAPGPPPELAADVVIFDLAELRPDTLALSRQSPHALLVGVDMAADAAIVFSREIAPVYTTSELVQVIRSHARRLKGPLATAPLPAESFN